MHYNARGMIAYLKGTILHKAPGHVTIDCRGVGYAVAVSLSTFLKLGAEGGPVELHIHTHLTDSALALYGFTNAEERDLFLKLIAISGIGPRIAMNVLSGMTADELVEAVHKNDIARISLIPGIGKKTALRIAMELADRIEKKESLLAAKGMSRETEDLASALLNMGFRRKEVERSVEDVLRSHKADGFEKQLRECLRRLSKV
jgi:Holliday junction DNA helicase RuvA